MTCLRTVGRKVVQSLHAVCIKEVQCLHPVCKLYAKSVLPHSLLLQAPYYGIKGYNDKIDIESREAFLSFSEKQHKNDMDDFETLFELYVTKKATGPIDGRTTTKFGGMKDSIAKILPGIAPPPAHAAAAGSPSKAAAPAAAATPPRNRRDVPEGGLRCSRFAHEGPRGRSGGGALRRFALEGCARRRHCFAEPGEVGAGASEVGAGAGGSGTAASALLPLMTGPTGPSRLRCGNGMKHVSSD